MSNHMKLIFLNPKRSKSNFIEVMIANILYFISDLTGHKYSVSALHVILAVDTIQLILLLRDIFKNYKCISVEGPKMVTCFLFLSFS